MIYIINEFIMNGSVTIGIENSGIEALSFAEAVILFKDKFKDKISIIEDTEDRFTYSVNQQESKFTLTGSILYRPLKMINFS